MKTCKRCGISKPIIEFYTDKTRPDGLYPYCKVCKRAASAAWERAHKERVKRTKKAWRKKNIKKIKENYAAWRAAHKEEQKAYNKAYMAARIAKNPKEERAKAAAKSRAWRVNNIERARAMNAAWVAKNKESIRARKHQQRVKKRESGKLSRDITTKLFNLQRGKCACCGKPLGDNYHIDHIMPLALGGSNTDDNVQLLRAICNLQKGAKHPIEFMQQRGLLL